MAARRRAAHAMLPILGTFILMAAVLIPERPWKGAVVAIVGGVAGVWWARIRYVDRSRLTPLEQIDQIERALAVFAFVALALAEVVGVMVDQHVWPFG
ncbi:MAG: hypothetical protein GC206_00230 [Alphaproteobacteria bacterium]|nr:hypothetical protein [Alphaproteobacteria bacterium]